VQLRADHPDRYVVVRGDTLWDISGRFLKDPWLWPEVWYVNPQIRNPHLIYPGDVIELSYGPDGKPRLMLKRGRSVVKLSPKVRVNPREQAVPPIPLDRIAPFLDRSLVLDPDRWLDLPYVLAHADQRPAMAAGDEFYGRGVPTDRRIMQIFRPEEEYRDAETQELLGLAGLYLGDARVELSGDPATLIITDSAREVLPGDRMHPPPDLGADLQFMPRPSSVSGHIIAVLDGVELIGQYHSVVLDRGARNGVEPGQVMGIYQRGEVVRDPHTGEVITLPDRPAGVLMVYRVFEGVSYGLVMYATKTIRVLDRIGPPRSGWESV
jgi:hypothetical protein